MPEDALTELFKQAAAIASSVPESMQEAAFHRALDMLTGAEKQAESGGSRPRTRSPGRVVSDRKVQADDEVDPVPALVSLDRSKAEDVDEEEGGLDKSLALLRVAHRELGIDGLTASQLAKVLTDKFRWRVTRQAVGQALDRAGRLVDRVPSPSGAVRYRLMSAGEQYLDSPRDSRALPTRSPSTRRSKAKKAARGPSLRTGDDSSDATGTSKLSTSRSATGAGRSTRKRGRTGPKEAIERQIDSGWFSMPRTLTEVREVLESKQGLRYRPTDLSPAMTRFLREGRLDRSKNESGQYEYVSVNS